MNKGPCIVEGCTNESRTKRSGLCSNHYQRMRRNGDPTVDGRTIDRPRKQGGKPYKTPPDATHKRCPICGEDKPRSEYYEVNGRYMSSYCKECFNSKRRAKRVQEKLDNPKPPKPTCSFEGCDRLAKSHFQGSEEKYCHAHYMQLYAGGELMPLYYDKKRSKIDGHFRRCSACDTVKTEAEFYARTSQAGNQSICKTCYAKRNSFNQYVRLGKPLKALRVAESMLPADRKKYMDKWATLFNGTDFIVPIGGEVNHDQ